MAIVIGAALFLVISTPDHSSEEGVRSPLEEQIYESVMERWEAIALEECNALRRYSNEQDYIDHIERHISERSMTLEQRISEDVVLRATELGVILDASTSEELSKEIVDRCLAIYQCLHTECY